MALAAEGAALAGWNPGAVQAEIRGDEGDYRTAPCDAQFGVPQAPAPEQTEYECDVLVVGSGYAGMHAAMTARARGASVIVVDKGKPGYSGCSPFANGTIYYTEEYDDHDALMRLMNVVGEHVLNLDQFETLIQGTEEAYKQNKEWGIIGGYNFACASGYEGDIDHTKEFFQTCALGNDRHSRVCKLYDENGIPWIADTMINDVIVEDGRIVGAVGLHVKSGEFMQFKAKAVVLATGPGIVKGAGFVCGGNSFEADYLAAKLGLQLVGQEFDDYHQTSSYAPGDYFYSDNWAYVEPFASQGHAFCDIEDTDEAAASYAKSKASFMVQMRINSVLQGGAPNDGTKLRWHGESTEADPSETDPRVLDLQELGVSGKSNGTDRNHDIWGAGPGVNTHMCSGIFCGWDDHEGYTGVPGLYCAGDGCQGDMVGGTMYAVGMTSHGCSVQGNLAGAAAAAYASGVELVDLPADQVEECRREIFAPSERSGGFDPNWGVDYLQKIMGDPLVHICASDASLRGALVQIEHLRDVVVPNLVAYTGHDLRIALELKHKVFHSEAKVKAKLFREESRGMHYRTDFPYRDDENFLCHVGVSMAEDGTVVCAKIDVPESWKGDLTQSYGDRYPWRFPGEEEALAERGIVLA